MEMPKVTIEHIEQAIDYIDLNGIPEKNKSSKYEVVSSNGKKYPPKYVLAIADHIAHGTEITTENFNSISANAFLKKLGFTIETKQEKYELVITANDITSTDSRFNINSIHLGDNYKPLNVFFVDSNGTEVSRKYNKGERKNCNQTLPRLACQIFEQEIAALSVEDKESFPVCKYGLNGELICGIFASVEDFRNYRKTIEYFTYERAGGRRFVIYCWNIFSTILFVQECLKRFGKPNERFVLVYREKEGKEETVAVPAEKETENELNGYRNPYSQSLIESKNIIFRGAPGTGKSYLAKEVATDIISNGYFDDYTMLSDEQKQQIEFVQFHPSYDYSDFVEGLRPKLNDDGSVGFVLRDGIFKAFVDRARKNYEDAQKSEQEIEKELTAKESLIEFFSDIEFGVDKFHTVSGNEFYITGIDDKFIYIAIPGNALVKTVKINIDEVQRMLESEEKFEKVKDVTTFFGKSFATQEFSYDFAIYNAIIAKGKKTVSAKSSGAILKKYVFIIDEINRGEISKILGELFFSIDPGYRGEAGEVSTQYSNMHTNPNEKFYVPENLYIIGTMNDIDRSVDTFDFAMRRRFRFIEIKADDNLEMLDKLNDEAKKSEAIQRMAALNKEILSVDGLNENYQIGAAYFLKLKTLSFEQLWTDYLYPLLQDYINGMYDEEGIMQRFAKAYGYSKKEGNDNEAIQD